MLTEAADCRDQHDEEQTVSDLACIQDWPVASAAAQITVKTFVQDILCGFLSLLLAFGQGLMGGNNKTRSAEATLRGAIFCKAICSQAIAQ